MGKTADRLSAAAVAAAVLAMAAVAAVDARLAREAAPARLDDPPVPSADDVVLGDPAAPVLIFEFASLTCAHCAAFHERVLPELAARAVATGRAAVVYRHFPLDAAALEAAAQVSCLAPAARRAALDALYADRGRWARAPSVGDAVRAATAPLAASEAERSCLSDTAAAAERLLAAAHEARVRHGVRVTPTLVVGREVVLGAVPADAVMDALARAEAR